MCSRWVSFLYVLAMLYVFVVGPQGRGSRAVTFGAGSAESAKKVGMTEKSIQLFLVRHSRSCSNYLRNVADSHDLDHPLVHASQTLLDPALTMVGRRMAEHHGPTLRRQLAAAGLDVSSPDVLVGSSGLRRARETAQILFPGRRVIHLPHIKERGDIPENTPRGAARCKPDWRAFLRCLYKQPQTQFAVVGHGSYLRYDAWPAVSRKPHTPFNNLDGFLVEGLLSPEGRLRVHHVHEIPYAADVRPDGADRCPTLPASVERKIVAHKRTMRHRSHRKTAGRKHARRQTHRRRQTRKQKKQRGGAATPMPLAYFQDGAQMRGTYADPTGASLASSSPAWIRQPMTQTSA